ncbi:DUF5906 domain-containing protein [Methylomicrobium sp. RS1]|uniref:DUF5906 domain-containing protein n=1 Tax=Candidatus Methylomicrobium oryzae TaxID=2802053 RepID=UPI0019230F27|nr:DUF5906 domain-containing protein [Methylomicrobium sp. RS1]MBL1263887.1 bifunctional DNA primase/polymerase [Methylomicrobium sp. RS1]
MDDSQSARYKRAAGQALSPDNTQGWQGTDLLAACCAAGLALVKIPAVDGNPTKAPRNPGWNKPRTAQNLAGYTADPAVLKNSQNCNFGLYHGASQTLALDLDNVQLAAQVFEEVAGMRLSEWLNAPDRAEIKSPKPNRGKVLFKLPESAGPVGLKQFKQGGQVVFELRCGNCQDVIFGRHPDGGAYQFIGDPAAIPAIPDVLLDMLAHWDAWLPCLASALGAADRPANVSPNPPRNSENLPGSRDPIKAFNESRSVASVLLENGYQPAGGKRFIRPGSSSKAPAAVLLSDFPDGLERVYSHGGDVLNDGFAHDAFDCFRLLQCGGDWAAALAWNPDITRHNQALFREQKAQQKASEKAATQPKPNAGTGKDEATELPDGTTLSEEDVKFLKQIDASHAHVFLGGRNLIASYKFCQVQGATLTFESPQEFNKRFYHQRLVGIGKRKNAGKAWLEWPSKRYFPSGTGFFPDPSTCPKEVFNLFQGWKVQPIEGDCGPYLYHLEHIMCAGDAVAFKYVVQWLAHLFQRPQQKPSVAILLKSTPGTGKGTMVEPVLEILGVHGNKTNGAYAIAGRFNGVVAGRLLIFADEVELTDTHVNDKLKGIISEPTVNLERKGLEIEPLPNYCRLIFASNHAKVLNADIRERRYLVLEPSDALAQDTEYFTALWAWIKNEGAAKLLHYLLQVDISDFNPYKCPQTEALIAEKIENLSGIHRFFFTEILRPEPFGGRARITASELIDEFIAWSAEDGSKIHKAAARNVVGRMMARMNIEVRGRSDRGLGKFYDLPDRAQLVQRFAALLDIPETHLAE